MPKESEFHIIAITGIIFKNGKVIITKRSPEEIAFPSKWTIPGGKIDAAEFLCDSRGIDYPVEKTLEREVLEEVNLKVKNIKYLGNGAFKRPDGHLVITLTFYCDWARGKEKISDDFTDLTWVGLRELEKYDIIPKVKKNIIEAFKERKENGK